MTDVYSDIVIHIADLRKILWLSYIAKNKVFFEELYAKYSKFSNLITTMGDVHHIFPKQYLIDNGINDKAKYNQVANFTYLDTPTNIAVGTDEPCKFFTKIFEQCKTWEYHIGNLK